MSGATISIRNVNHNYGDGALRRQVLFDVSLDIAPGEIVILTGPSGSGKTTLLTLCGGLRTVQEGSLSILGTELHYASRSTLGAVREKVGVIFQAHHLLDALTARQNVALALGLDKSLSRKERNRRADAMLECVGLGDRIHFYPSQMSGGQKQRVAAARALVRSPKIILADEPTASLDRKTGREVIELLHSIARDRGCAVLLVTHDNRISDVADRIVRLEDGRLTSYAGAVAPAAGNMLQAFSRLHRSGELAQHVRSISAKQYMEMLEHMTAEFRQYLRVLEIGNEHAAATLFNAVFEAVTLKMFDVMQPARGSVCLIDPRTGALNSEISQGSGEVLSGRNLATQVAVSRRHANAGNILCVPLLNRNSDVIGIVELSKKDSRNFSTEEEERLLLLAEPVGSVLACCLELKQRS